MNKLALTRLAAVVSLTAGMAVVASIPAQADGGGGSNKGRCSMHSTWELKGSPDHGKIRVEVRVDTGHAGQVWAWQIMDNGTLAVEGQSRTGQSSNGRFEVQRRIPNNQGVDQIQLTASNAASGESCVGQVNVRGRN